MDAFNYLVIGQTGKAFHPRILAKTNDEEIARTRAQELHLLSQCDVSVFDYKTGLCIYSLTLEAPEH